MSVFFPNQPELKFSTNNYVEYRPIITSYLRNIALYYEFTTLSEANYSLSIVPDGCFDLLFCLHETHASAYLWTTPFSRKEQLFLHQNTLYFGVRFWPEQHSIIFKESMHELIEKVIPLANILTFDEQVIENLFNCDSFNARIQMFNQFLDNLQQEYRKEFHVIQFIISELYKLNGLGSLEQIASSTGYSPQFIRRLFERFIGLTPKQFAQIVQLQCSLDLMEKKQNLSMLDLVYEAGYYDQAHFIKAFKKFMHITPKQFIKMHV